MEGCQQVRRENGGARQAAIWRMDRSVRWFFILVNERDAEGRSATMSRARPLADRKGDRRAQPEVERDWPVRPTMAATFVINSSRLGGLGEISLEPGRVRFPAIVRGRERSEGHRRNPTSSFGCALLIYRSRA
jgi:hypothetical protein